MICSELSVSGLRPHFGFSKPDPDLDLRKWLKNDV